MQLDLSQVRTALANQISKYVTSLRINAQATGAIAPPCAVIIPGNPFVKYGSTMGGVMLGPNGQPYATDDVNLIVMILMSASADMQRWQQTLDGYLGFGAQPENSIPYAIEMDPTLGKAVMSAVPTQVSHYGIINYAGVPYVGAQIDVAVVV